MPRDGAIIFRDIAGKLAVLRITCDKCEHFGRHRVDRLIVRYRITPSCSTGPRRSRRPARVGAQRTHTTSGARNARTCQR
jgi:hypothetical protein